MTEELKNKISTMSMDSVKARKAEIQRLLDDQTQELDIDAIMEEVDELNARSAKLEEQAQKRSSLLAQMAQGEGTKTIATPEAKENSLGSMKYRKAFMNYFKTGKMSDTLRETSRAYSGVLASGDAYNQASDLGVMLPETVVQKIITDLDGVYGHLYNSVTKLNIKGGVKFPIGSFSATFNRITETTVSNRQKGGSITGYVQFGYLIGEIRLARTLLETILTVEAFEAKLAEVIVKAYVKAMDTEIMKGDASANQCEGILTEAAKSSSRISADHIIEFTATEMADWKSWQTKLFAQIPLAMRGLNPEFVMTANTWEANIKTLADDNNRPVYTETYNPVDGAEICRFKGHNVALVEEDILYSFDDATAGQYFGMYWVGSEAYAINSNMQFQVVRYFDHETNQDVTKALVVNDGKVLDPQYIYLLKKKA